MRQALDRTEQVAAVLASLHAARVGVAITGHRGVGKTYLSGLVASALEDTGHHVVTVTGAGHDDVPYGAIERCLGSPATLASTLDSGAAPTVVAIGDVDAVDVPSLAALTQAASGGHARLLVTLRSGTPLPHVIDALLSDGSLSTYNCSPLGRVDTATLLEELSGAPLPRATAHEIHELTGGNAMLIREVVEAAEGSMLTEVPLTSDRLVDLVERTLAALEPDEREVLRRIAIVGSAGPAELAPFVDDDILRRLADRGLVDSRLDERRLHITATPPLVAAVIRASAPALVRRQIQTEHSALISSFTSLRADDRLRLASWTLDGVGSVDAAAYAEAAWLAGVAGELALSQRLAEAAFALEPTFDMGRLVAARQYASADFEAMKDHFPVWEQSIGTDDDRAAFAAMVANAWYWRGFDEGSIERFITAHDWSPGFPRDKALSTAAQLWVTSGQIDRAIEITGRVGELDPGPVAVVVAMTMGHAERAKGRPIAAAARVSAALDLYSSIGPGAYVLSDTAMAGLHINALAESGRFGELDAIVADRSDSWADSGDTQSAALASLATGFSWFVRGEYDRALTLALEARYGFDTVRQVGMSRWAVVLRAICHAESGEISEATAVLDELASPRQHPARLFAASLSRAHAWVAHHRLEPDRAIELLHDAADRALDVGNVAAALDCLHDLARPGQPGLAAVGVQRLPVADLEGGWHAVRVARIDAASRRDVAALGDCMVAFDRLQCRHLAAECALTAATVPSISPSDARQWLQEAAERQRAGTVASSLAEWPLTSREKEVAQLAVSGLTSRQIAERLGTSRRTVDSHLGRIYTKLDIDGRAGLVERLR
ncbi:MAG: LuxR C-terminal-related transcriptional regulator [Ilumatobacteraceae bacterium]